MVDFIEMVRIRRCSKKARLKGAYINPGKIFIRDICEGHAFAKWLISLKVGILGWLR